jgi:hypothetical protein
MVEMQNTGATAMPKLASVQRLISEIRDIHAQESDLPSRWQKIADKMPPVLTDPQLALSADQWPTMGTTEAAVLNEGGGPFNLLFYEDADYGFVINGAALSANVHGAAHSHAPTWTAFGVVSGTQDVLHLQRQSETDARLVPGARQQVKAGFAEVVDPEMTHAEITGDGRCTMLIVRSQRIGDFLQDMYNPDTGELIRHKGPRQIPYDL